MIAPLVLSIDQCIEGIVESIAFGGEGIVRYCGFVVFVPYTAIGDQIVCRIKEVKRSFAKGELVAVKHASKDRSEARCPYFGTCGGCQLQHLTLDAQLNYKLSAVHDALKRIGHLSPPPFTMHRATENWAYRRHVTLHLRPNGEFFEAGYIGHDNHSLVVIRECPIFHPSESPIISLFQQVVRQIPNPKRENGRVMILKNQLGQYILSFQFGPLFDIQSDIFETIVQQHSQIAGIIAQIPGKQLILGNPGCEQQLEGLTFHYSPQLFIQNHPEQSAAIYRQIRKLMATSKITDILDLYCGFGVTTLLLAQNGHQVTGIENNPQAIQFAKENAALNGLKNAHFLLGNVEKVLPNWLKNHHARAVVVNPPRQGLSKEVVELLLKTKPQTLIYVSCMPATLARDLQALSQNYRIKEGFVYDMFPQTAHVETLIHCELLPNQ